MSRPCPTCNARSSPTPTCRPPFMNASPLHPQSPLSEPQMSERQVIMLRDEPNWDAATRDIPTRNGDEHLATVSAHLIEILRSVTSASRRLHSVSDQAPPEPETWQHLMGDLEHVNERLQAI